MSQSYLNYPISRIPIDSGDYPEQLRKLSDPPKNLYYRGVWNNKLFEKTLAIVGSRRITGYGERVLDMIIPSLVAEKITIISGFMYGVDSLAHQKCLECGGKTIAVLGSGLNVLYPPENEKMYLEIVSSQGDALSTQGVPLKKGLVISEYPPDQQPQLWTFPQRNRIVAALSTLGVLVVEASEKSGSLVTAKIAKKLKKPLFAIPGPITSSVSRGTNQLIKGGLAKMVLSVNDIIVSQVNKPVPASQGVALEARIMNLLAAEPLTLDEIALKLNKNIIETGQTLTMMSLKGIILESNGKYSPPG